MCSATCLHPCGLPEIAAVDGEGEGEEETRVPTGLGPGGRTKRTVTITAPENLDILEHQGFGCIFRSPSRHMGRPLPGAVRAETPLHLSV